MTQIAYAVLVGLGITVVVPSGYGQCENKQAAKFFSIDVSSTNFGLCLAVSGHRIVTSAAGVSGTEDTLYVFEKQTSGAWQETAKLPSPPGMNPTYNAIAIEGDAIAAGFPSLGSGSVFVFEQVAGAWQVTATLFAPTPVTGSGFGTAVAFSAGRIFVGAPLQLGSQKWAVFAYEKQAGAWTCAATIVPSPAKPGQFGRSLAVDGNRIVVGAPYETTALNGSGAAYVFDYEASKWVQKARLASTLGHEYGVATSIAVLGPRVLLGSGDTGAFMFENAGLFWIQTAALETADPAASSLYGSVVGLSSTQAFVSDQAYSIGSVASVGAVFVFEKVGIAWASQLTLLPSEKSQSASFGSSLAVMPGGLAVGAVTAPGLLQASGAVYEMKTSLNPPAAYGSGCSGSAGFVPVFAIPQSVDGCVFPSGNLTFSLSHALGGSSALVLLAPAYTNIALPNGCPILVAPIVGVIPIPLFGFGPGNGTVTFSAGVPTTLSPGSIYMQAIAIDPGTAGGFSATNGLRVTVN